MIRSRVGSRSRKFWKAGVGVGSWKFWKGGVGNFGKVGVGVGVGYFTSDSATLPEREVGSMTPLSPFQHKLLG